MKSVIERAEENKEIKYPCLMESGKNGQVVLFAADSQGTLVFSSDHDHSISDRPSDIGYYIQHWDMSCFTPFTGKITLSNGE